MTEMLLEHQEQDSQHSQHNEPAAKEAGTFATFLLQVSTEVASGAALVIMDMLDLKFRIELSQGCATKAAN